MPFAEKTSVRSVFIYNFANSIAEQLALKANIGGNAWEAPGHIWYALALAMRGADDVATALGLSPTVMFGRSSAATLSGRS